MGQVPRYGIIGDGAVARHFAHYFDLAHISYVQWSRKLKAKPSDVCSDVDSILILIKDSAIEGFVREWPMLREKPLIHFSGSLVTSLATGMHPLMTFSKELYPLSVYESIPFICDEGGLSFAKMFPKLKNPHFTISKDLKPRYHALCVLSGNFTILLWQKLFHELEDKLHLPRGVAIPYLEQIMQNLVHAPEAALTGPIARKDQATINRNLIALKGDPYEKVYRAFLEVTS